MPCAWFSRGCLRPRDTLEPTRRKRRYGVVTMDGAASVFLHIDLHFGAVPLYGVDIHFGVVVPLYGVGGLLAQLGERSGPDEFPLRRTIHGTHVGTW